MSGDPNELTDQEAQIHEEWRGEEMDQTAEPRTLAIDPVRDFDCCHNPPCAPGLHKSVKLAMARADEVDRLQEAAEASGVPQEDLQTYIDRRMSEELGTALGVDPAMLLAAVKGEPAPDHLGPTGPLPYTPCHNEGITDCEKCGPIPGRPHEQGSATDVLPVSLTHAADQPRTLRQILFTHRALAGAKALEITELMAEVENWASRNDMLISPALDDARRQRDNARGRDQLFRSAHHQSLVSPDRGTHEGLWVKANPGLVALLQAVDGA